DLVWDGPIAGVRVGRIDGQFVAFPTFEERERSTLDLIVAASRDAIVMVEGEMSELAEDVVIDALFFAHQAAQPLLDLQDRLRKANGKEKRSFVVPKADEGLTAKLRELGADQIRAAFALRVKQERYEALSKIGTELVAALCGEGTAYHGREKEVGEGIEARSEEH